MTNCTIQNHSSMINNIKGVTDYHGQNDISYLFLKIGFAVTNNTDPDGMPHITTFYEGLNCLQKHPVMGFYNSRYRLLGF